MRDVKGKKDHAKAPQRIVRAYEIWANLIEAHGTRILKNFSGYNDERLSGEWSGYRSSRLNKQWRVIYGVNRDKELEIVSVERVTPHDYRRKK